MRKERGTYEIGRERALPGGSPIRETSLERRMAREDAGIVDDDINWVIRACFLPEPFDRCGITNVSLNDAVAVASEGPLRSLRALPVRAVMQGDGQIAVGQRPGDGRADAARGSGYESVHRSSVPDPAA